MLIDKGEISFFFLPIRVFTLLFYRTKGLLKSFTFKIEVPCLSAFLKSFAFVSFTLVILVLIQYKDFHCLS